MCVFWYRFDYSSKGNENVLYFLVWNVKFILIVGIYGLMEGNVNVDLKI